MVPDAPNWLFCVFSFISFILCLIPLPWHLEAWNTGTCLYIMWTSLGCLNAFINSVVWYSDTIDRAPVFCDISAQISLAVTIAVPATSLCIARRLYKIASIQSVTTTPAERRREVMIDVAIGVGIPLFALALHPLVQSHRYLIYEEIGCQPFTFNTPPAYAIYFTWPLAIGLISASYAVRTIRELAIRRAQFREYLAANKNLSSSRYFRLMGLASVDIVFTIPLGTVVIWVSVVGSPIQAWQSWANAHAGFLTIGQIPSEVWRSSTLSAATLELTRWDLVLCAFVFFAFFGFADEARRNYRLAYESVTKRVGLSTGSWSSSSTNPDSSYNSGSGSMPVYITQQTEKKRDSFVSFSSRMSLPDIGGALADVKKGPLTSTTMSSASTSKESLPRSPVDMDDLTLPRLPVASLDTRAPPRYTPDVPRAV